MASDELERRLRDLLATDTAKHPLGMYEAVHAAARIGAEIEREECAALVEVADDGVPLQCLADAIREARRG